MTHRDPAAVVVDAAPALLGYFLRRVDVPAEAADLVSETTIAAWKVVGRMPSDDEAARMWLFGVARNVLRHHHRGNRRRDALVARLAQSVQLALIRSDDSTLEVREAVDALPPELGELVRLVHWDGFTIEAAATHLGLRASTARSRHARAKQLLRAALDIRENAHWDAMHLRGR